MMGILNIHYLFQPDTNYHNRYVQAAFPQSLIEAHRRGEHLYGSMRRECPLCQAGK